MKIRGAGLMVILDLCIPIIPVSLYWLKICFKINQHISYCQCCSYYLMFALLRVILFLFSIEIQCIINIYTLPRLSTAAHLILVSKWQY